MLNKLKQDIQLLENKEKSLIFQKFFKTKKGKYGEGDIFLGLTSKDLKQITKQYYQILNLEQIKDLLYSKIHEHRSIALSILVLKYQKHKELQEEIADFYLKNTKQINNWDLVDLSSYKILGDYLINKNKDCLYNLAKSTNLWEKRIAIISTYYFIKNNKYQDALNISEILLNDTHDLIHKAVGWMLREIGKRNQETEEQFLKKNYKKMPRTMLRYAIEKFDEIKRQNYLKNKI